MPSVILDTSGVDLGAIGQEAMSVPFGTFTANVGFFLTVATVALILSLLFSLMRGMTSIGR
jgi:hypothetical protein